MNSELYNTVYDVPNEILGILQNTLTKFSDVRQPGYERASNIVKNKKITYQQLKRIKNYFDSLKDGYDQNEFDLNGGDKMRNFVNSILNSAREKSAISKNNNLSELHYFIDKTITKIITESEEIEKSAVGILYDSNKRFLIVNRGMTAPWEPAKWSFVGGGVESGESFEQALVREFKEELHIDLTSVKFLFDRFETETKYEKIFLCTIKEGYIRLSFENDNFMWASINELKELSNRNMTVPLLYEYAKIAYLKINN